MVYSLAADSNVTQLIGNIMKLLFCIIALTSTLAYCIDARKHEAEREFFASIYKVGAAPQIFKRPNSNKNQSETGLGIDLFPECMDYIAPWLRWSNVPAPQILELPETQLNTTINDHAAFQQRLDALAVRVAAMETHIKSLK